MDQETRQLETNLQTDPFDFVSRTKLTSSYLRNSIGKVLFWRGAAMTPADSFTHKTEISYEIGQTTIKEQAYLLSVLGLNDLTQMLSLSPDAILDLQTKKLYPLNGRNLISNDAHSSQFNQIQLPPGRTLVGVERFDEPIYDRQIIEPGTYHSKHCQEAMSSFTVWFYDATVGQKRQHYPDWHHDYLISKRYVKGLCDTNLDQVGSFPYPQRRVVLGFSIIPDLNTSLEDFENLINISHFRVFIGTMSYLDIPGRLVIGLADNKSIGTTVRIANPAGPHYVIKEPWDLIPQQNYRVELNLKAKELKIKKQVSMICIMWCTRIRHIVS